MKKTFLLLALIGVTSFALSQNTAPAKSDKIYKADNTVIDCKIIEVLATEIKYKKANYLDGPTYSINKSDVVTIQYANGDSEVMNVKTASATQNTNQSTSSSNSGSSEKSTGYSAYGIGVHFTRGTHFGGVYEFMWALGTQSQHFIGFSLGGYYSIVDDYSGGTLYVPFQYRFFPSAQNFYIEGTIGPRYTSLSYVGYDSQSLFTVSEGFNVGYVINGGFDLSVRYHSYMGVGIGVTFTGLSR